jgi:hypothetical protein
MIHHGLGVAVIAARRDFLAPDPRIERVIAPFNFAVLHINIPLRRHMPPNFLYKIGFARRSKARLPK